MQNDFYVLGIGMSAGGLQSLNEFFTNLHNDLPLSIILVTHLQEDYREKLFDILHSKTNMQVEQLDSDVQIQRGCIYVLAAHLQAEVEDGVLKVKPALAKHAIDSLLSSLGRHYRERAIGMILSGTGTDGAKGLLDISENGGQVLIQEPFSALYQSLPRLAIKVDHPDKILPPIRLAGWINKKFGVGDVSR
jgi:chemotaxis response regulator CheB